MQLGVAPPRTVPSPLPDAPANTSVSALHYADWVAPLIDADCRGDSTVRSAHAAAGQIRSALERGRGSPQTIVVLGPRFAAQWEPADVYFIRALQDELTVDGTVRLLVVTDAAQELALPPTSHLQWDPELDRDGPGGGWLEALVPGVLDASIAALLADRHNDGSVALAPLRNGCKAVIPGFRVDPRTVPAVAYDELAAATAAVGWVNAYAQLRGNRYFADARKLWREAVQRHQEGATTAARQLAEAAAARAPPPHNQLLEAFCQSLNVAVGAYEAAASAPAPPAAYAPAPRAALHQAKGWSLAMVNRAAEAERHLVQARAVIAADPGLWREHCYLLNITARVRLQLGDLCGALELEREVADILDHHRPRDWQLTYVNQINLARLYRRSGDFDKAEFHYERAFQTAAGLRSPIEWTFLHATFARLREAQERFPEARQAWLRAALHWLVDPVPQATGARVVHAIANAPAPASGHVAEFVAAAFLRKFEQMTPPSDGIRRATARGDVPAFADVRVASPFLGGDTRVQTAGVLSDRIGLVALKGASGRPQLHGPNYLDLRRVVHRSLCHHRAAVVADVVCVDDRHGRGLAATPVELAEVALGLGIRRLYTNAPGEGTKDHELSASDVDALTGALTLSLAEGLDRDGLILGGARLPDRLVFRRHLEPRSLLASEQQLLELALHGASVASAAANLGLPRLELMAQCRKLEEERILSLSLPTSAWASVTDRPDSEKVG